MHELYNTLSIFFTGGLFLALGLMLLLPPMPESPLLGNYRRARRALAGAYLFFIAVEAAEYLSSPASPAGQSIALLQTVTLIIAASQAFLFTFAMLALLETRFPGWRTVLAEALPVLGLIAGIFAVYAFCTEACFRTLFYGFGGLYALLLVRYTWLFVRNYRRFRRRMDNYYSGNEADRMRWVAFSFCAALAVGIGALMTSVFMTTAVALGFTVVFDVFYTFFAIRFAGYATRFHVIEAALENEAAEEALPEPGETAPDNAQMPAGANFDTLDRRIEAWIAEKGYTEKSITINMLVPKLYTNRHALSTYINTCKGKSFRDWINGLRIEEAMRLMTEYPDMTVGEVAGKVGIPDKSNFSRTFTRHTQCSPKEWKEQIKTS